MIHAEARPALPAPGWARRESQNNEDQPLTAGLHVWFVSMTCDGLGAKGFDT